MMSSTSVCEHLNYRLTHVGCVMTVLREAEITLRLRKEEVFPDTFKFLGHIICLVRLPIEEAWVRSLIYANEPRTKTELYSFL